MYSSILMNPTSYATPHDSSVVWVADKKVFHSMKMETTEYLLFFFLRENLYTIRNKSNLKINCLGKSNTV